MSDTKLYNLKNRSSSRVVYTIPEMNISRDFALGEVKKVTEDEIRQLSYIPGGARLLEEYLVIEDTNVREQIGMEVEPEYELTEAQIVDLIKTGDMDHWEDTLNFAPQGVIDLIKQYSVSLPLTDMNKAQMLKEKTGFDALNAIALENAIKADSEEPEAKAEKPVRKATASAAPARKAAAKPVNKTTAE